jgi:hypothetical protein
MHLLLIRRAPLNYLREVLSSFVGLWLPSTTWLANMGSDTLQAIWVLLQLLVVGLFALQLIVIAGLIVFRLSQQLAVTGWRVTWAPTLQPAHLFVYCLAGTIVLYNALITSLVEVGDPRFQVPTAPLIVCMCFLGFHVWHELLRRPAVSSESLL